MATNVRINQYMTDAKLTEPQRRELKFLSTHVGQTFDPPHSIRLVWNRLESMGLVKFSRSGTHMMVLS